MTADELLLEAYDKGYLKDKVTGDLSALEDRVAAGLSRPAQEPVTFPHGMDRETLAAWLRDRGQMFDPYIQGRIFDDLATFIENTKLYIAPLPVVPQEPVAWGVTLCCTDWTNCQRPCTPRGEREGYAEGIEKAARACDPDANGWNNSSDRHIAFSCIEKISALLPPAQPQLLTVDKPDMKP